MLRIKTIREEFDAAETGGYVYGEIRRSKVLPVYIELGTEEEYIPSPTDNPNTEYRLFRECNVFIAETDEQLDRGEYLFRRGNVTIVIYC